MACSHKVSSDPHNRFDANSIRNPDIGQSEGANSIQADRTITLIAYPKSGELAESRARLILWGLDIPT